MGARVKVKANIPFLSKKKILSWGQIEHQVWSAGRGILADAEVSITLTERPAVPWWELGIGNLTWGSGGKMINEVNYGDEWHMGTGLGAGVAGSSPLSGLTSFSWKAPCPPVPTVRLCCPTSVRVFIFYLQDSFYTIWLLSKLRKGLKFYCYLGAHSFWTQSVTEFNEPQIYKLWMCYT